MEMEMDDVTMRVAGRVTRSQRGAEIASLQSEMDIPVEEIMRRYKEGLVDNDEEVDDDDDDDDDDSGSSSDSSSGSSSDSSSSSSSDSESSSDEDKKAPSTEFYY